MYATSILLGCRVSPTPLMKLSEGRVRELMRREGISSVAALAERTGIDRTYFYEMWESDTVTLATLRRLARPLRATLGELVEEEPLRPLAACEKHEYREMIDMLEAIPATDRDQFVTFVTWTLRKMSTQGVGNRPAQSLLTSKAPPRAKKKTRSGMGFMVPENKGDHDPSTDTARAVRDPKEPDAARRGSNDRGGSDKPRRKRRRRARGG